MIKKEIPDDASGGNVAARLQQLIYVIVDRFYKEPRHTWARTSLWKDFLRSLPRDTGTLRHVAHVSISDRNRAQRPKTVRIDSAQIVIVNWCAANGDYICGSDDVFLYFLTRSDRRNALLRNGGKLICELQSGKGVLHQGAYDAIFGPGEIQVAQARFSPEIVRGEAKDPAVQKQRREEESKWTNSIVVAHKAFRKFHPLLAGLQKDKYRVLSTYDRNPRPLFNFDDKPQERFFAYNHRDCIYNAWFQNWEKRWVPLLVAEPREPWSRLRRWFTPPPAVLLAKCHEGGLMLASTMWMAVPGAENLVRALVDVKVSEVHAAHDQIERRRKRRDGILAAARSEATSTGWVSTRMSSPKSCATATFRPQ